METHLTIDHSTGVFCIWTEHQPTIRRLQTYPGLQRSSTDTRCFRGELRMLRSVSSWLKAEAKGKEPSEALLNARRLSGERLRNLAKKPQ